MPPLVVVVMVALFSTVVFSKLMLVLSTIPLLTSGANHFPWPAIVWPVSLVIVTPGSAVTRTALNCPKKSSPVPVSSVLDSNLTFVN